MDRLKPIDLDRHELKKRLRGYDARAADELFRHAAREIETLLGELKAASEEREKQRRDLDGFLAQETTLKEALLLAQKTADETRASAHKQAELIVEEANQRAAQIHQEMQGRLNDLRWDVEKLQIERKKFLGQFRSLLEQYLASVGENSGGVSAETMSEGRAPATNGQGEAEALPSETPADE